MGKAKSAKDELEEALRDSSESPDELFSAIDKIAEEELYDVPEDFDVDDVEDDYAEEVHEGKVPAGSIPVSSTATATKSTTTTTTTTKRKETKTMENNFNVGDIVVGKEPPENGYYVLDSKSISEVTGIQGEGILTVRLLYSENPSISSKKYLNQEYKDVAAAAFRMATSEEKNKAYNSIESEKAKKVKKKVSATVLLKTDLIIQQFEDGSISSSFNKFRDTCVEYDEERKAALTEIIKMTEGLSKAEQKVFKISKLMENEKVSGAFGDMFSDKYITSMLDNMINFFKEFQFEPNFRFINTLAMKSGNNGYKATMDYVKNYFALTNSPFADAIAEKIKSPEFKEMIYALGTKDCSTQVNKRLKCYVGSQGCGKTTKAMIETDGRVIVCNNSMLPQDLLEDFSFDDGKPGFHPSILVECMEQGKGIVLDEMNLLPFESLRFLQGILDGKKEFIYKGNTIHVKDGFFVISTMNLVVNSMVFGLPEPLVDRAMDIQFFSLNASQLLSALA